MAKAIARAHREDYGSTASWKISGEGPRILLVHGFRGDHHGLLALAGALPNAELVIPDLPGYGKTPAFEGEHNLENYGSWLREFVSRAGSFDLVVSHSFGTLVLASAFGQGFQAKSVMLNPITTRASDTGGIGNKLAQSYYRLGEQAPSLLASPLVVRGMSVMLAKTSNPRNRAFIHEQHARYFSGYRDPRVVTEGFRAASGGSVLDFESSIQSELLLVAGEKDIVAPVAQTAELHKRLPNSQLAVIPRVGHLTHYETPAEVADHIERFVQG